MINIRQASLSDLEGLAILFDQYRIFYQKPSDLAGAKNFLKARIEKDESVIFVSSNTEEVITGFTQLYPLFSSTRLKRVWLLNDLFVEPTHRGKGISVRLIERAKEHCRQTGGFGLTLETAKVNEIGNTLYPRAGFVLDQEHNYYSWEV